MNGKIGQRGRRSRNRRAIESGNLAKQDIDRPTIQNRMMAANRQQVVRGRQAQEVRAE
jgi:hypothetical protein